jgi:beta-galactosidase GanA
MLYMVRDGFAARAEAFVASGGHLVTTYWTGIVNDIQAVDLFRPDAQQIAQRAREAAEIAEIGFVDDALGGRDRLPE